MNLDEQLRAALNQEAEMQDAPAHDVNRLISGGRVRRRRRNAAQVGVAAAVVAVLVGVGVYGVTQLDPGNAAEPARPAPTTSTTTPPEVYVDTHGAKIEPGTYRMLVGIDDTGVAINADLTFDGHYWNGKNYPVLVESGHHGGVAVYRPEGLAGGTGCVRNVLNRRVSQTSLIVRWLAQLPRSTVVQGPTEMQAFGRNAVHLQLQIDNDCVDGYRVAETPRGSHEFYDRYPQVVVIDFWVLEVQGVPVVVDMWHEDGASSQLLDRIARTRDSIAFVTGG